MPFLADVKDWTWVLDRRCPECGFDASSLPRDEIAPLVRANAPAWVAILSGGGPQLRQRPRDDRWSPLEYACHVRDVFVIYNERLSLMLTIDNPTYPNWDQDRTAEEHRYNDQPPATVAAELAAAAASLAANFESITGAAWGRRGRRSDGADFTVDSFGRYMIHDPIHHLHDVTADLTASNS